MHMFAGIVLFVFFGVQAAPAAAPSDPWTGLESGRVGKYAWEVKTKSKGGAQKPCLMVGTTWELSPFNYRRSRYRACAGVDGQLTAADPPLIATGVQPSSGEAVDMTAVGMLFAPTARKVRITRSDGRQETIELHRLTQRSSALGAPQPLRVRGVRDPRPLVCGTDGHPRRGRQGPLGQRHRRVLLRRRRVRSPRLRIGKADDPRNQRPGLSGPARPPPALAASLRSPQAPAQLSAAGQISL